jgi:predicted ABC-type ATPase
LALILAGPNGSGKTTAAGSLIPSDVSFINADAIAEELSGKPGTSGDINAGRILLERLSQLELNRCDFAFETTLATRSLSERVRRWVKLGYHVHLIYIWLPSKELCVERVRCRVHDGGHQVPEATIRRRFDSGLDNFLSVYRHLVGSWHVYDNSTGHAPSLVAKGAASGECTVFDKETWAMLTQRN